MSMPFYLYKEQIQKGSSSGGRIRMEKTRSGVSAYKATTESPKTEIVRSRKPRDKLIKSKGIMRETAADSVQEIERLNASLPLDLPADAIIHGHQRDAEESERYKDIFSNEAEESEKGRNKDSDILGGKDKDKDKFNNTILRHLSFSNKTGKTLQCVETSDSKYNRNSQTRKTFKIFQSKKHLDTEPPVPELALDEVAIQAMVSILRGYIRRFLKNEEFRASIHYSCSSCLSPMKLEEGHKTDGKVIANLEERIETVEEAAQRSGDAKELKKASLQPSVITSLNSKDLKDGFTSGIPNSLLSACAHLYLSVICKIQKKDRISAKRLLQVFCNSPSQARMSLLSELWDFVFLPHLSHSREWYDQEVTSIPNISSRPRKYTMRHWIQVLTSLHCITRIGSLRELKLPPFLPLAFPQCLFRDFRKEVHLDILQIYQVQLVLFHLN